MKFEVTVDEVGRLVLPKSVRERLGIRGRTRVDVEVVGDAARISLSPPPVTPMIEMDGRLLYSGALPEDWDSGEAVTRMRDSRIRR